VLPKKFDPSYVTTFNWCGFCVIRSLLCSATSSDVGIFPSFFPSSYNHPMVFPILPYFPITSRLAVLSFLIPSLWLRKIQLLIVKAIFNMFQTIDFTLLSFISLHGWWVWPFHFYFFLFSPQPRFLLGKNNLLVISLWGNHSTFFIDTYVRWKNNRNMLLQYHF
jgi:hypothetical protein